MFPPLQSLHLLLSHPHSNPFIALLHSRCPHQGAQQLPGPRLLQWQMLSMCPCLCKLSCSLTKLLNTCLVSEQMSVTTPLQSLSFSEVRAQFLPVPNSMSPSNWCWAVSGSMPRAHTAKSCVPPPHSPGPCSSLRWHFCPSKDSSHAHRNQEWVAHCSFTARRWF